MTRRDWPALRADLAGPEPSHQLARVLDVSPATIRRQRRNLGLQWPTGRPPSATRPRRTG